VESDLSQKSKHNTSLKLPVFSIFPFPVGWHKSINPLGWPYAYKINITLRIVFNFDQPNCIIIDNLRS